jgi:hypothetical protein
MVTWLYFLFTLSLIFNGSCTLTSVQNLGDKGGRMPKLAPELIALYDEYSAYLASHRPGVFRPANPLVRVGGDRVVIDAVASEDATILMSDLMSLGIQGAVSFGRIVSGQLPISAIPAMAGLPSLQFARAAAASTRGEPLPGR